MESGYYTRLDRFQDDLLHLIVANMNTSLVNCVDTAYTSMYYVIYPVIGIPSWYILAIKCIVRKNYCA